MLERQTSSGLSHRARALHKFVKFYEKARQPWKVLSRLIQLSSSQLCFLESLNEARWLSWLFSPGIHNVVRAFL